MHLIFFPVVVHFFFTLHVNLKERDARQISRREVILRGSERRGEKRKWRRMDTIHKSKKWKKIGRNEKKKWIIMGGDERCV